MYQMFDPTVYENLKVVLEGAIYDLDLDGLIQITERKDIVDLATLSRTYQLQFEQKTKNIIKGEIKLFADINSFTEELIYNKEHVGCELTISLFMYINNIAICEGITSKLNQIWENRPIINQSLSFPYPNEMGHYKNKITISFDRKITEAQIDDIPVLIEYTLKTMDALSE
jgi:hypothetical protein